MQQNSFYKDFNYEFLQIIACCKGVNIRQYFAIQVILLGTSKVILLLKNRAIV